MDVHSPHVLATLSLAFAKYAHSKKVKPAPARCVKTHSVCDQVVARSFVLLTLSFILCQAHGFYFISLPWFQLSRWPNLIAQTAFGVLVASLLSMLACTCMLDPGSPPAVAGTGKSGKWCERCMAQKPERCHHCSICDRCVLKMDHHCVFTNSCIGARNHPHFLTLVALATFGCGSVAFFVAPQLPGAFREIISFGHAGHDLLFHLYLILLTTSASVCFALLWDLLLAQLHNLLRNETTIESIENWAERRGSPYDSGAMKNVVEVFGPRAEWFSRCILYLDCFDQFLTSD